MQKIAFRFDANNFIGMGHAARCVNLAEELCTLGFECVFFCKEDAELFLSLEKKGYSVTAVPQCAIFEEIELMKQSLAGFRAVVLDSYFLDDNYISDINAPGRVVCCIDDNALYRYNCDMVINGNFHAPELLFRFGQKRPDLLLGGRFCLLKKAFSEAKPVNIREKANKIFLCMGGSDLQNFSPRAASALQTLPGTEISAVLGPMTKCDEQLRTIAGNNVRIYKSPDNLPELMRSCDIAVTAAGSMVYELAAVGLPSVIVPQADNQRLLAEYLRRNRLMTAAGDYTAADLTSLRDACQELISDYPRRKRESAALQAAIARDGAKNVAVKILEAING